MLKRGLFISLLFVSAVSFADAQIVCPPPSQVQLAVTSVDVKNSSLADIKNSLTNVKNSSAEFIYCGPAVCTPNTDSTTATCKGCYQMTGENIGTLSCEDRAPQKGVWTSSFSARKDIIPGLKKQPLIFCEANDKLSDQTYADCLDSKCTITNKVTGEASCQCNIVLMQHGESFATEARSCATADKKCNAQPGYILNGAPTPIILPILAAAIKTTGQSLSDLTCISDEKRAAAAASSQIKTNISKN